MIRGRSLLLLALLLWLPAAVEADHPAVLLVIRGPGTDLHGELLRSRMVESLYAEGVDVAGTVVNPEMSDEQIANLTNTTPARILIDNLLTLDPDLTIVTTGIDTDLPGEFFRAVTTSISNRGVSRLAQVLAGHIASETEERVQALIAHDAENPPEPPVDDLGAAIAALATPPNAEEPVEESTADPVEELPRAVDPIEESAPAGDPIEESDPAEEPTSESAEVALAQEGLPPNDADNSGPHEVTEPDEVAGPPNVPGDDVSEEESGYIAGVNQELPDNTVQSTAQADTSVEVVEQSVATPNPTATESETNVTRGDESPADGSPADESPADGSPAPGEATPLPGLPPPEVAVAAVAPPDGSRVTESRWAILLGGGESVAVSVGANGELWVGSLSSAEISSEIGLLESGSFRLYAVPLVGYRFEYLSPDQSVYPEGSRIMVHTLVTGLCARVRTVRGLSASLGVQLQYPMAGVFVLPSERVLFGDQQRGVIPYVYVDAGFFGDSGRGLSVPVTARLTIGVGVPGAMPMEAGVAVSLRYGVPRRRQGIEM